MLLVGTEDGNMRVYRNTHKADEATQVTSWAVNPKVKEVKEGKLNLITTWDSMNGKLYAGGSSDEIRIWDCNKETWINSIEIKKESSIVNSNISNSHSNSNSLVFGDHSMGDSISNQDSNNNNNNNVINNSNSANNLLNNSNSNKMMNSSKVNKILGINVNSPLTVTSMCLDNEDPNVLLVGCSDGFIKLYDIRNQYPSLKVTMPPIHHGSVIGLSKHRTHIVSASPKEICMFDVRMNSEKINHREQLNHTIDVFAAHPYAPVVALLCLYFLIYTHTLCFIVFFWFLVFVYVCVCVFLGNVNKSYLQIFVFCWMSRMSVCM